MRVTWASAQATAWAKPNRSVRLQLGMSTCVAARVWSAHWMPSFSRARAAWIPSQVDPILIKTRSREIPASSYRAMICRALALVASSE